MAKKRKSEATRLDEVDRGMYTSFSGAANFLSQLYSQAMHQQRVSFHAGERHALEKLYSWILRQQEDGIRVVPADIVAYIQNELDCGPDDHPVVQSPHSGIPIQPTTFGPTTVGQGPRSGNPDQTKNSIFSNALSSPVRLSLQNYHLTQPGGQFANNGSQTRDPNPPHSNDTSMDIHPDSPGHDSI